jgi:hypothetical protein
MKTAKEALACYLCIDKADLTKANYKKGQFTKSIYKIGDAFYAAKMDFQQLPRKKKHSEAEDFQWQEIPDPYVNDKGWKIYRAIQ